MKNLATDPEAVSAIAPDDDYAVFYRVGADLWQQWAFMSGAQLQRTLANPRAALGALAFVNMTRAVPMR